MDHEGRDILHAELLALRAELSRMATRVAELESPAPAAAGAAATASIGEDTLLAIAAAVAAFLGAHARLRQVRLVRSTAWAQQGRVTVQASHSLAR